MKYNRKDFFIGIKCSVLIAQKYLKLRQTMTLLKKMIKIFDR